MPFLQLRRLEPRDCTTLKGDPCPPLLSALAPALESVYIFCCPGFAAMLSDWGTARLRELEFDATCMCSDCRTGGSYAWHWVREVPDNLTSLTRLQACVSA